MIDMSPLGFDYDENVINLNDSAELVAKIYTANDQIIDESDLSSVEFTIQAPDGTMLTETGQITEDSTGFLRFLGTDQVGEYKTVATFTLSTGEVSSVRSDFEVINPFSSDPLTGPETIRMLVWRRFEDLFDSEEGGPWVQDVTKATFKKEKMDYFIQEALFEVNQQNPPTTFDATHFFNATDGTANGDSFLLIQGVTLAVMRHLIRSYTEQPNPTGGQVVYEDRRDYLQRWQSVLQAEEQKYTRLVALWKRQFLGLGGSKVLVGSKAGRTLGVPGRSARYYGARGYGW